MNQRAWYPLTFLILFVLACIGWTSFWFPGGFLDQLPGQLTLVLRGAFPLFVLGQIAYNVWNNPSSYDDDDNDDDDFDGLIEEQHNTGIGPYSKMIP